MALLRFLRNNPALGIIGQLLTTPRPQGMPMPTSNMGPQVGGGIAGVASNYEGDSIKVYNERQKYDEWEFVYDMKKDKRLQAGANGQQPGAVPNPLNPGQNQGNNQGNNQNNNPFGGPPPPTGFGGLGGNQTPIGGRTGR